MNPEKDSIYAGLAGIKLNLDEFELAHGITISKTFAHIMTPFLMAFSPPKSPSGHHPAPWKAVHGGMGADFEVQLFIPKSFNEPNFFDRLNTVWFISALLRLKFCSDLSITSITSKPFREISHDNTSVHPAEFFSQRFLIPVERKEILDKSDLVWLDKHWFQGGKLMGQHKTLNVAFRAVDSCASIPNPSLGLVLIWGALEALFVNSKAELSFRTSAAIASYLEPFGKARFDLHKQLTKLYSARSAAAHGSAKNVWDSYVETYSIVRRALLKMIGDNHVPSHDELEQGIFGLG